MYANLYVFNICVQIMNKAKFYLEPKPSPNGEQAINMFYSVSGKRFKYYTGVRISIKDFQKECNTSNKIKPVKSTAPHSAAKNTQLVKMAAKVVSIVAEAKSIDLNVDYVREEMNSIFKPKHHKVAINLDKEPEIELTFITHFQKIIKDSETGKRLINTPSKAGQKFSFNAVKNYRTTLAAVKRFFNYVEIEDLSMEQINESFYNNFRSFCFDVEEKEISTFAGYVKDIKTIMKESKTIGFESSKFILPAYESDTIYLSSEQIDQIASLDLSNHNEITTVNRGGYTENVSYKTLEKVRDLFLIGAYTGLRFSDFSKLDINSIDKNFIKLKQVKTGARVVIPIMSKLRPILTKYPTELPTISNQKFNFYIKYVAELSGLTKIKEVKRTKGNKETIEKEPICNLISSHCCRRSYATNMFNAGFSPMLIMSATGHKTESSFLKYIRATSEDKANLLAEALLKSGM